jgi:HlyD family secretion protein
MRRRIRIIAALLVVSGAAAAAVIFNTLESGAEPAGADALPLHGNVDIREVLLAFSGDQRIEATMVEEGASVAKGQLLATLDRRHLLAEVTRMQAKVETQRHRVEELKAGTRPADIRAAEARMAAALAKRERAATDLVRFQALLQRSAASPQQRDTAKADAEVAAANYLEAVQLLELAREGPRAEEIAAAESTLQADEAELALARHRLEDAYLYAPAEGVIRNRLLEAGEMAAPDRPVFSMALTNPLWIRAYVDGANLSRVRHGIRAWVSVDSASDKRYEGWVGFISPTAEFTPRSVQTEVLRTHLVYEVRVLVCNPDGDLRLGMPATVSIPLPQQQFKGSASCDDAPVTSSLVGEAS